MPLIALRQVVASIGEAMRPVLGRQWSRTIRRWLLFCALFGGVLPLFGQLPTARLVQLFPPGGRVGTTFEVTVAGSDLDDPVRIHFSRNGISAVPASEANRFTVTIASNVPPGVYEARFVGRFGISNPRAFAVGALPEFIINSTNGTIAGAVELPLNTTLDGRAPANAVAWYKFSAKKAQRLFIDCAAEELDSRMDPKLVLQDAAGRELEHLRTGGSVDFIAPADGVYFLKVSDFLFRGGDNYFYRLTLSNGPRVDFVLPPAWIAGTRTNFLLFGRNLPGGKPAKGAILDGNPLEYLAVEIAAPSGDWVQALHTESVVRPGAAAIDGFEYRMTTPKVSSNPVLIGFATAPVALEREPNDKPAQAQKLTLPCEVAGQFYPAGEQDWFTFDAKKGEVFWVEVLSHRLGLPTDPFVLIQRVQKNEKGEEQTSDVLELYDNDANIGDREFNTASRDPVSRFEVKEDGTYRVLVRDLFQRVERSSRFVYRLSLRKETPDFRLVAMSLAPKFKADAKNIDIGVPLLRRGETIAMKVIAFRQDGFNGDIQLSLENPPPGLIFEGDRIPAGQNSDFILLTAAENAPGYAGPVKLVGKAKVGDKELVREVRAGTLVFPVVNTDNERPESRLVREFDLAISDQESAPISIAAAEKKIWEGAANEKLQIPLQITRRGDFNANLKLKPLGPGVAAALKDFEADGKATNATLTLDLAALKLAPGLHAFAVQTQTTGKYRNNPEAAALAEATAKEADKLSAELAAAAKSAAEELDRATKAVQEADAAAKAAAELLASAKAALEKAPADEKLISEKNAAESAGTEATAKARSAAEARVGAEKAKVLADDKSRTAREAKEAAAVRARQATERAKPKDVTILVHSTPIQIRVTAPAEQAKSK